MQFANFGINNPIKADCQLEIIRSPTGDRQIEPGDRQAEPNRERRGQTGAAIGNER